jgi:hypothetical protein
MSYAGDGLAEKGKSRLRKSRPLDQRRTVEGSGNDQGPSAWAMPSPTNSAPQSAAAMPDSAPAGCNACKGRENTGRKVKVVPQSAQRPRWIPIQS